MGRLEKLLEERTGSQQKREKGPPKIGALAERSSSGGLSGFAGVFSLSALSKDKEEELRHILTTYLREGESQLEEDWRSLVEVTQEVRAIANQAALLHGERIKRAQAILKNYREGAFTSWLIATYGNRQTPYNFLQYYEFYTSLPPQLKEQAERMPRQALYTLASRKGDQQEKETIVGNFAGETKRELLHLIRKRFPLPQGDQRGEDPFQRVQKELCRLRREVEELRQSLSSEQRSCLREQVEELLFLFHD